jgi:predicted transcriptional regulator
VQGIAELSAVPGIAKGVVRNIIKKKSKHAVMLDWSGDVAKSYNFKKDSANLFLIDKQGNIVSRQTGAADPAKLANFYKEIDTLLK